jgi:hypothetical protein
VAPSPPAPIGAPTVHDSTVMTAILIVGIASSLQMSANSYRPSYIFLYSKRAFHAIHLFIDIDPASARLLYPNDALSTIALKY